MRHKQQTPPTDYSGCRGSNVPLHLTGSLPAVDSALPKIRFFDAFSGIGGFKIALERVGFEGIGFCDNDKYANQLYLAFLANNNEVHYEDIRQIDTTTIPNFEIFCGGFPCQSFSIAGKRRGFEDTRGTLFFEVARILQDKKPKYFILENVKGLLNHNSGRTFARQLFEEYKTKFSYPRIGDILLSA